MENQLDYYNGRWTILLENQQYYWKINRYIERSMLLLEDQLYYWKINCVGRSVVLLDQLYWRQSTSIDGNYRSRKITARRWLHKYVRAECSASSFTWYLYQICNADEFVCPSVDRIVSALYLSQYWPDPFHTYTFYQATSEGMSYVKYCSK